MQLGLIRVTYLALDHMNKLTGGRGGVIVNTASMAGEFCSVLWRVCIVLSHSTSQDIMEIKNLWDFANEQV